MDATLSMISLAVAIAAAVVVFAVSARVLQQHSPFGGPTAVMLALCMSVLTALALLRHVPVPASDGQTQPSTTTPEMDFILLPYAALGLTLLLLPFVLFVHRRWMRRDAESTQTPEAKDPLRQYVDAFQYAWTQVTRPTRRFADPMHEEPERSGSTDPESVSKRSQVNDSERQTRAGLNGGPAPRL